MDDTQNDAVARLNAVIEEERAKREEAENFSKALVEEFTSCNDFDDIRAKFKEKLKEVAPRAILNIIQLADHAESESVKAAMNKYIIEWVMSDKFDTTSSELATLLKKIQKKPVT